jgi:transaldolase
MTQEVYASYRSLLGDDRWTALARARADPQRVLWASTSTRDLALPDTYYLGKLAAPRHHRHVPEKTLLAFADHGQLSERLSPDDAGAEHTIAEVAADGEGL